jgi:phosphate transport system substrate-binding protein
MRRPFALAAGFIAVTLCLVPLIGAPAGVPSAIAAVTAQITGSGSTWAQNAIEQWIADVSASQGLQVVYTGSGSAQGRTDFRNDTTDFAVSDIGFQGFDPSNDTNDTNCQNYNPPSDCRPYAYLPIVAGGTSFPYQIRVGGQLVTNLRLSGETLAKIFTLQITNWDDPEITADNDGHRLPDLPIIPVVDSEGSGASYQFTEYLNTLYPKIWQPFAKITGPTEYFPRTGSEVAEPGSSGIINFVTSAAADGAIGYDEYSYARNQPCIGAAAGSCTYGWPVALLKNSAGYFTAPTQYNVAVALTKAEINMDKSSADYLLQNLSKVYTNPDKRAYAMSSYSYMIIPTSSTDPRMSTPKRQTLADYIDWAVCGGQAEMGPLGYSPLPVNLAQASFEQMYKLHTADPAVQISQLNIAEKCFNPTFWAGHPNGNLLAQIAPQPPSCDQTGQAPCPGETGVGSVGNPVKGKPPAPPKGPSSSPTPTEGPRGKSASPSPGKHGSPGATPSPSTGSVPGGSTNSAPGGGNGNGGGNGSGGSNGNGGTGSTTGTPVSMAESDGSSIDVVLAVLASLEVLLLLAIPPIMARRRQQRGTSGPANRGGAA